MKEKEMQAAGHPGRDSRRKDTGRAQKRWDLFLYRIGEGINEIFRGLGVDYIIEGGQTMNPSTEDMLNAIEKVNAKNIFILPNNKNIILAANQAASLVEDKNIFVIPTRDRYRRVLPRSSIIFRQSSRGGQCETYEQRNLIM